MRLKIFFLKTQSSLFQQKDRAFKTAENERFIKNSMMCFYTVWEIIWWNFLIWYCFLFESLIRVGSDLFFFFLYG